MPTLTPPTVEQNFITDNYWFRRYRGNVGVSLLVTGSVVVARQYPSQGEIADADFYYAGGHVHEITTAEAATLVAAGYGAYIV